MRLHPVIPNTVGLWQLQSDLLDSSGNGLTAVSVAGTTNAPLAPNAFTALGNRTAGVFTPDACLLGLPMELDVGPKLMIPFSSSLLLTGPLTIQWIMMQQFTTGGSYFACANPAGRSGGAGQDRIGSLYTVWSSSGNPGVSDQHIGSNLPSPFYGNFPGYNDHTLFNWADVGRPNSGDYHTHVMAVVRDAGGNWQAYRDGVTAGVGIVSAGTNTAAGNERLFIGGYESAANGSGVFASVRVLNVARSAANIAADAFSVLSPCGGYLNYRGAMLRMVG